MRKKGVAMDDLHENSQDDFQDEAQDVDVDVENQEVSNAPDTTADSTEPAEPAQNAEDNAIYAAARRKAESEAMAKVEAENQRFVEENLSWITNPDTGKPFTSIEELAALKRSVTERQIAENLGVSQEQYFDIASQVKEDILKNDPQIQNLMKTAEELRKEKNESIYKEVLQKVKAVYPDEKAIHIKELGEQFLSICANGVDPVVAYEAIRNNGKKKTQNPSMGDVAQSGNAPKDYFTKDEVDKMSDTEIKTNYDTIRNSMKKWK